MRVFVIRPDDLGTIRRRGRNALIFPRRGSGLLFCDGVIENHHEEESDDNNGDKPKVHHKQFLSQTANFSASARVNSKPHPGRERFRF
jgi:hypothetical protein